MAAPKTGRVVKTRDGRWQPVVTLSDGTTKRLNPFTRGTSRKYAKERALFRQQQADRGELVLDEPEAEREVDGETVAAWFERWIRERERRGIASVRSDRSRWRTHIAPSLNDKHITDVSRADVEALVRRLDDRVSAGELSWKTAINAWALLAKAFDDACNAKNPELRVLETNPAASVRGPDRGTSKAKTYLYPDEFLQFVTCTEVPLEWRRRVALAVYLFPRAAELEALEWSDVDVERGILHIHRAADRKSRDASGASRTKPTKTGVTRRFAIEPRLLPLLKAMHRAAGGAGRVDPGMPPEAHLARELREQLHVAELKRPELFADDATRKPLGFHDRARPA